MNESREERTPDVGEHDDEDSRGGGGPGGLSGAAPGAGQEPQEDGQSNKDAESQTKTGDSPARD